MAKRKTVAANGSAGYTVTAVLEPRRLSEVVAVQFTARIRESAERLEKAKAAIISDIQNGYIRRGCLSTRMHELHAAATSNEVWLRADHIRFASGIAAVLEWAVKEREELIDAQAWQATGTDPWTNVARSTEANVTIRTLGGRHDSVIDNVREVIDGLKDGSIVDDTQGG